MSRSYSTARLYEERQRDLYHNDKSIEGRYDDLFHGLSGDNSRQSAPCGTDIVKRRREPSISRVFELPGDSERDEIIFRRVDGARNRSHIVRDRDVGPPIRAKEREEFVVRPRRVREVERGETVIRPREVEREEIVIRGETPPPPLERPNKKSDHRNAVVCNISRITDITLHLQLESADDIDADLEEFSRLSRLGKFADAKKCFTTNLAHQKQNPYLLVQYAQMMLDSGDYRSLNALDEINVPHHKALQHNWELVKSAGSMCTSGDPSDVYYAHWQGYLNDESEHTSTELQSMVLQLRNMAYVYRFHPPANQAPDSLVRMVHRSMQYRELLTQGRIWDFRDAFTSLVSYDCGMDTLSSYFGTKNFLDLFDKLITDWDTASYDESTKLALLDISESLFFTKRRKKEDARQLVDKATALASSLLHHNPSFVTSRQYIRWILARVSIEAYDEDDLLGSDPPAGNPGIFLSQDHALRPPVYIPFRSENPTLLARRTRPDLVPFIKTALDGARRLEDYETEALCLQALVYRTEDPAAIYDELAQLQKGIQNDVQGCLHTYLSKYAFCRDEKSRAALRDDILSLGNCENFPLSLLWARAMILRALSVSKAEVDSYVQVASTYSLRQVFPGKYHSFMGLVRVQQKDHEQDHRDDITREQVSRKHRQRARARTRRTEPTNKQTGGEWTSDEFFPGFGQGMRRKKECTAEGLRRNQHHDNLR